MVRYNTIFWAAYHAMDAKLFLHIRDTGTTGNFTEDGNLSNFHVYIQDDQILQYKFIGQHRHHTAEEMLKTQTKLIESGYKPRPVECLNLNDKVKKELEEMRILAILKGR